MFYRISPVATSEASRFQPATLLKRDFVKYVFLLILQNFYKYLFFWQNTSRWLLLVFISEFTGAFQVFYARSRSSHSKAFICLKSLKTVCKEVNLLWSCEMPTRNFMKKSSFTHPPSCILPSFSQNASRYFFRRGFGSVRAQFLSGNISGK